MIDKSTKMDDNTPVKDINTITNPVSKTLVDRYVFASNFCKGKKVLDCPSEYGYGAMILRGLGATAVDCFDIDEKTIEYINNNFGDIDSYFINMIDDWNKKFNKNHITNNNYNTIVCIEGFEHIPKENVSQLLKNFKYACKDKGTIIITTPRRKTLEWKYDGGTHFYEYNIQEFSEEIEKEFKDYTMYYAREFTQTYGSDEVVTTFNEDPKFYNESSVMVAVITNEK